MEAIAVAHASDAGFAVFRSVFDLDPAEVLGQILGPGDWRRGHALAPGEDPGRSATPPPHRPAVAR